MVGFCFHFCFCPQIGQADVFLGHDHHPWSSFFVVIISWSSSILFWYGSHGCRTIMVTIPFLCMVVILDKAINKRKPMVLILKTMTILSAMTVMVSKSWPWTSFWHDDHMMTNGHDFEWWPRWWPRRVPAGFCFLFFIFCSVLFSVQLWHVGRMVGLVCQIISNKPGTVVNSMIQITFGNRQGESF